jgi:hypothetical protein
MPHSTVIYPFEHKILTAITELSVVLYGNLVPCLLIFDQTGSVVKVSFSKTESTWFDEVDLLRGQKTPHLFFDPSDVPQYVWLSWLGIHRSSIERLIGEPFKASDLQPILESDEHGPLSQFPSIWEVMFEQESS